MGKRDFMKQGYQLCAAEIHVTGAGLYNVGICANVLAVSVLILTQDPPRSRQSSVSLNYSLTLFYELKHFEGFYWGEETCYLPLGLFWLLVFLVMSMRKNSMVSSCL